MKISSEISDYQRVLLNLLKNLPSIITKILDTSHPKTTKLSCGEINLFGKNRLVLLDILLVCFQMIKDHQIIDSIMEEGILEKLMVLYNIC